MAVNYLSETEMNPYTREALFSEESVVEYIKKINKIESLTHEQETECAKQMKEGSLEAKRMLISANLKLVVTIAKKVIKTSRLPMTDLIQEGNAGLMVAAEKYNYKFGYRFSTYASWWIKQSMFKAISEQSHCVRIPVYIQETLSRYSKIKSDMEKELKRSVETKEAAERMNTDEDKINSYLNAYKQTISLEGELTMKNGSEVRVADIIEDGRSSAESAVEYEFVRKNIDDAISRLKDRERNVIMLRFGLNGEEKRTLEDIGKIYGVTKECIRQTENRVISKLRNNPVLKDLYNCI